MRWPSTVCFNQPLREVTVSVLGTAADNLAQVFAQREKLAYDRGLTDGEKALSEQLLRQRAEFVEMQNGVLTALRQAVGQVIQQTETSLIQLAFEVASKLVGGLPISPELVEASVRTALDGVDKSTIIALRLHPSDLALLQEYHSTLLTEEAARGPLRFQSAPEVSRGGCLVETRFGVVDGRRETRLERLEKALLT